MSTITRTARIAWAESMPSSNAGIVEVAELAHEPLGVERPALAVAGGEARPGAGSESRRSGEVANLGDLQVMAGDAFVVADRDLAPEREAGLAERRVPRPPRTGEVFARAGVVHGRRAAGRCDHGLATTDRLGDVEVDAVERGDGGVDQLLVPALEGVDAFDDPGRVRLERGRSLRSSDGTRSDLVAHLCHPVLDAVQLVPPELVGVLEIEVGAGEIAGRQGVALPADRDRPGWRRGR